MTASLANIPSKRIKTEPCLPEPALSQVECLCCEIMGRHSVSIADIQRACDQGADPNLLCSSSEATPLELAMKLSKFDIAEALLKAGARPAFILKTSDLCLPARAYCERTGIRQLLSYFPQDVISEELAFRRFIAHLFSISGTTYLEDYYMPLEGAFVSDFVPMIMDSIQRWPHLDVKMQLLAPLSLINEPGNCYNFLEREDIRDTLIQDYQNKLPLIIPIVEDNHFYALVLYKNYLIICNRGKGLPKGLSTLDAHVINPALVTRRLLKWIHTNRADYDAIYTELPFHLKVEENWFDIDPFCDVVGRWAPKLQKVGNCAYANLKAAIKAAWLSIVLVSENPLFMDEITLMKQAKNVQQTYRTWIEVMRIEQLNRYKHRSSPQDELLALKCSLKLKPDPGGLKAAYSPS